MNIPTEIPGFFEDVQLRRIQCDPCGYVRAVWSTLDPVETGRMVSKAMAGIGWLRIAMSHGVEWACPSCAEQLQARLISMPRGKDSLAIGSAISERLFHSTITVQK
jgi:C4-type Zn-finger protein